MRATQKEQGFQYDPAFEIDDVDAQGVMATPNGNIGSLIANPTAIIGKFDVPTPVIEVFADNIPHGLRDFVSGGTSNVGSGGVYGRVNGGGWVRRALLSLGLPYAMTSKVGHLYGHMAANYAKRAAFFKYSTHALFTLGINDLNAGVSADAIISSASPIWAAYRAAEGQGVYQATILPRLMGNIWFGTNVGIQQTYPEHAVGGEKDKLNVTLKNLSTSLLDGVIDIASPVSDKYDPSKWAVPSYRSTLAMAYTPGDTILHLTEPPSVDMMLVLAPGQDDVDPADFNVLFVSENIAVFSANPFMHTHAAGTEVCATMANDGTHPSAKRIEGWLKR